MALPVPLKGMKINMYPFVPVQLHEWPWSVGIPEETHDLTSGRVEFPFYGSPVVSVIEGTKLFLPHRHEQFRPVGPVFKTHAGNCQLFQSPHGLLAQANKGFKDEAFGIRVRTGQKLQNIRAYPLGAAPRYTNSNIETELARAILAWSQFFDDLLEQTKDYFGENQLPWQQVKEEIEKEAQESGEPRKALIVGIAERMYLRISFVVKAARKILQRERRMMPAGRVNETDRSCIRWLVRQPGKNLAVKAANHKQQLKGITRIETHDTLENRVLKDFLFRCAQEGNRYLKTEVGQKFIDSKRARQIRSYRHLSHELYHTPHLKDVETPPLGVRPNYVLQNDYRYKQVWREYKRLLRREDEEDCLWDWQSRTWGDIARVMVCSALYTMTYPETNQRQVLREIMSSRMRLHREHQLGSRMSVGSEPGPYIYGDVNQFNASVLEIVHPDQSKEHPVTKFLGRLGAQLYIVVNPLFKDQKTVIAVWAIHTAGSENNPDYPKIAESAGRALRAHQNVLNDSRIMEVPLLKGFVLASDLEQAEADLHGGENGALDLVQVGVDQRCWKDALAGVVSILELVLEGA